MGLRFRKRIKIAPGLYINLGASKKGITTSASVGVPGMNVNIGKKKDGSIGAKRGTLGITGTGVRHDVSLDDSSKESEFEIDESEMIGESGIDIFWWLSLACILGLVALHWNY